MRVKSQGVREVAEREEPKAAIYPTQVGGCLVSVRYESRAIRQGHVWLGGYIEF
jgi:hypothetical protein